MNPTYSPFLLAGINLCLVILLVADRWVHKVTGPTSLEGRVLALESQVTKGNERLSDKMSELTVYLEARRHDTEALRSEVYQMKGEMLAFRGYRRMDT